MSRLQKPRRLKLPRRTRLKRPSLRPRQSPPSSACRRSAGQPAARAGPSRPPSLRPLPASRRPARPRGPKPTRLPKPKPKPLPKPDDADAEVAPATDARALVDHPRSVSARVEHRGTHASADRIHPAARTDSSDACTRDACTCSARTLSRLPHPLPRRPSRPRLRTRLLPFESAAPSPPSMTSPAGRAHCDAERRCR